MPAFDKTGEPLLGPISDPTPMPDGTDRAAYNVAHGRKADAPTSGGPRAMADTLINKTKGARIPAAFLRSK